jgi:DNA invertase Pin-like site-specific DNA recombinase
MNRDRSLPTIEEMRAVGLGRDEDVREMTRSRRRERREIARALRASGVRVVEIARMFGCARQTVYRLMQERRP